MEITEQLYWLKGLTVRFGVLHEAQVQQLKMYPLCVHGINKATVNVDISHKVITFDADTNKFRKTQNRINEIRAITFYTRKLLWDESNVIFKVNGKIIYDSKFDNTTSEDDGKCRDLSGR